MRRDSRKSIDGTKFSECEILEISETLGKFFGAKQKVIEKTGLSGQSFFRAMRGEYITNDTKKRIQSAYNEVSKLIETNP